MSKISINKKNLFLLFLSLMCAVEKVSALPGDGQTQNADEEASALPDNGQNQNADGYLSQLSRLAGNSLAYFRSMIPPFWTQNNAIQPQGVNNEQPPQNQVIAGEGVDREKKEERKDTKKIKPIVSNKKKHEQTIKDVIEEISNDQELIKPGNGRNRVRVKLLGQKQKQMPDTANDNRMLTRSMAAAAKLLAEQGEQMIDTENNNRMIDDQLMLAEWAAQGEQMIDTENNNRRIGDQLMLAERASQKNNISVDDIFLRPNKNMAGQSLDSDPNVDFELSEYELNGYPNEYANVYANDPQHFMSRLLEKHHSLDSISQRDEPMS